MFSASFCLRCLVWVLNTGLEANSLPLHILEFKKINLQAILAITTVDSNTISELHFKTSCFKAKNDVEAHLASGELSNSNERKDLFMIATSRYIKTSGIVVKKN